MKERKERTDDDNDDDDVDDDGEEGYLIDLFHNSYWLKKLILQILLVLRHVISSAIG